MAAANESQGLKIAVAAFIALTVILTVTSYFLYSAYSSAEARLQSANEEAQQARPRPPSLAAHPVRGSARRRSAPRPPSTIRPRKRSALTSRRSTSGSTP